MLRRDYQTYRIIPDSMVKNNDNQTIAQSICSTYIPPIDRMSTRGLVEKTKVYFDIEIKKGGADFFITLPDHVDSMLLNKVKTVWNKSNIHEDTLDNSFNIENVEFGELVLKDFNFKSLNTSRGDLYPLTNLLGLTKVLNEGERIRVSVCFEPMKRIDWVERANQDYKAFKKGKQINRETKKSDEFIKKALLLAESGISIYLDYKLLLLESFMGIIVGEPEKDDRPAININLPVQEGALLNNIEGTDNHSAYKRTAESCMTRILILSESEDKQRAKLNLLSAANTYKDLSADNELILRLPNRKYIKEVIKHNFDGAEECILCDKEMAKLIQLPQSTLQQAYGLQSIDTKEVKVPEEGTKGKIRVAEVNLSSKNKKVMMYFSDDVKKVSFTNVIMGPEGCGKTTQIKRIAKECSWNGYSNFMIDFIEDNKLAKEVIEVIDPSKVVVITLGGKADIPALAYNEVSKLIKEDTDNWLKIHYASMIAEQVEYLINSITSTTTGELTDGMVRLLNAACRIVFVRPNATIGDVLNVLKRHDKRMEAISYAKGVYEEDSDLFYELDSINEYNKDRTLIIGTKNGNKSLEGVLSRFTQLTKVPYLEKMLKAKINPKDDLDKWIQEGKSIFILIPQNKFPNKKTRDIITTYYTTRIWLAAQIREDNSESKLCNLIFDEVHQMPNTASFISEHVNEFRRHRLGLTISCHYLAQFKALEEAMLSKRTNYIICQGTQKNNVIKLQEEILPFTLEDLSKLKLHEAICSINYTSGRHNFIGKLPK